MPKTPIVRTVVVDEDPAIRQRLVDLLSTDPALRSVGAAASGRAALDVIGRENPDLVFLQLDLPDIDGFEVLKRLPDGFAPMTIFLAPDEASAFRAFEFRALDYLQKPLAERRIRSALEYAKKEAKHRWAGEIVDRLSETLEGATAPSWDPPPASVTGNARADGDGELHRIVARRGKRTFYIHVSDIEWIEAVGYYVRLHVRDDHFLVRRSMKKLATALEPRGFFRIHRSYIVRLDRVEEVRQTESGEAIAVLRSGPELPVSRYRREEFQDQLRASD